MEAYKSKITDDQAAQLKNDLQLFKTSEKRERGKEARKAVEKELGKPKRPLSGYFLFAKDLREKSSEKVSAANVTAKWKALGDAERTVYIDKAAISHVNYRYAFLSSSFFTKTKFVLSNPWKMIFTVKSYSNGKRKW